MAVAATGFFDGVHPGHRLVIQTLLSEALRREEQSFVVTFWPHPRAVLQKGAEDLRYLCSRSDREEMLRSLGVGHVETVPFTREFASLSAVDYVRMLRDGYGCTCLVLGYDTRFGSEQTGPEGIAAIARSEGVDSIIVPPVCMDGPISSTRIRAALEAGDVALGAELLGRPYRLGGVVIAGNKIGRTIGFPTANMKLYEPLMLVPKPGVYRTVVHIPALGSRNFDGMTNIGFRPTIGSGGALTVETHILGFDEMIYGLDITVDFVSRIREERQFPSLEALAAQLAADAAAIK